MFVKLFILIRVFSYSSLVWAWAKRLLGSSLTFIHPAATRASSPRQSSPSFQKRLLHHRIYPFAGSLWLHAWENHMVIFYYCRLMLDPIHFSVFALTITSCKLAVSPHRHELFDLHRLTHALYLSTFRSDAPRRTGKGSVDFTVFDTQTGDRRILQNQL